MALKIIGLVLMFAIPAVWAIAYDSYSGNKDKRDKPKW